jgi:hypothetical protein
MCCQNMKSDPQLSTHICFFFSSSSSLLLLLFFFFFLCFFFCFCFCFFCFCFFFFSSFGISDIIHDMLLPTLSPLLIQLIKPVCFMIASFLDERIDLKRPFAKGRNENEACFRRTHSTAYNWAKFGISHLTAGSQESLV